MRQEAHPERRLNPLAAVRRQLEGAEWLALVRPVGVGHVRVLKAVAGVVI